MSTFIYNNVEYTQVFIDPTKTVAGDGTTPANALFDFPQSGLTSNTAYIIRRTDENPNNIPKIPNGTYDAENVIITGMPKSTDLLYKFMNDTEKTAWDADEAEYAMCCVNNTTAAQPAVTFSAINDFIVNRCYLFRNESHVTTGSVKEYVFDITNANANTTISNCKWSGYLGDDLDKDEWLAANEATNTKNFALFVKATGTSSFSLQNCVLNGVMRYFNKDPNFYSRMFFLDSCANISIVSNTFNLCSYNSQTSYRGVDDVCVISMVNCYDVISTSNTFNMIDRGNFYTPFFTVYNVFPTQYTTNTIVLKDTKVKYKQMKNNIANGNLDGYYGCCLFSLNRLTHYTVEDFDFDFSDSEYYNLGCALSIFTYNSRSPNNLINNISIKYNTKGTQGQMYNSTSYGALKIYHKNNIDYNGSRDDSPIFIPAIVKATNIDISVGYDNALYMYGACVEATSIYGQVMIDYYSYLKVGTLTNPRGDCKCIYIMTRPSTIQIDTLNVVKDNTKYPYDSSIPQIQFSSDEVAYCQNIFVNHCDALPFTLTTYSTTTQYAREATWVANDYNGLFIARNTSATAKSWGVTRAGTTAQASFKLETFVDSHDNELILGCNPCTGFMLTPDSTGEKTITAYFGSARTYNSFAGINNKIWLEALVKQEDGSITTYRSNALGSIEQDDSTWEGDSGVQPLKIVMPVTIPTTDPVEVKVHFHWFDTTGYTYLDPELHIA